MNNQTTNPVFHGSDIEKISACYHIKKEAIVNFAGNVNPLGLPASVKEAVATHAGAEPSFRIEMEVPSDEVAFSSDMVTFR